MIFPIKNKEEQNVRNQIEKRPFYPTQMAQLWDFPELYQVRSMLENKLVEVQSTVNTDIG